MGSIRSDVRSNYLSLHPEDEDLLTPFLAGFFVTWAKSVRYYNTDLRIFFLNPEPFMKEAYGFENEIMLVYAPYPRMEPRTMQAVEQIFTQSPAKGRVETLNYFLISDSRDIQDWLSSYTSSRQESRIIVPFISGELKRNRGDAWYIRNKLNNQFFGKDLFNYTLPLVEDTYFFGRQSLIMEYFDAIKSSENKAIFGLRKTGKTSFLFKLKRLIESEKIGYVNYYDCKKPDIRKCRWFELLEDIAKQIAHKAFIKFTDEYTDRKASRLFYNLVKRISDKNIKVCLIFDEVEYISFVAKRDLHWHEDFLEFWQTIWSCQSEIKNISFILAGVNPSVVEKDLVCGIQNPLFGIVPYKFLQGFDLSETKTMLKTLGKRMGVKFSVESIQEIWRWYGGHPLLVRLACSWLNTILSQKERKPLNIEKETVTNLEEKCDYELIFYCNHVISELREFYQDQYFMLELLASGQLIDFKELAEDLSNIKHLEGYGLIEKNDNGHHFTIPVLGKYIGKELSKSEGRELVYKIIPNKDRKSWIGRRKDSIINDLRLLERLILKHKKTELFGVNSFPEADELIKISPCDNKSHFSHFINTCNRCFVESIESYGRSINKRQYFWDSIKNEYPNLFRSLHRIKVYRNERDHLELTDSVNQNLLDFLDQDLEGKKPSELEDYYFILQQRVLDSLLYNLQLEIDELN